MTGHNYFALIVATKNRPKDLHRFLVSVAEQDYQRREVIVIDQSTDEFARENENIVNRFHGEVVVRYRRSETTGLSRARNEGLALVQDAHIIAFPDDDCWYHPTLLRRVNDRFNEDPDLDILLGQYADPDIGSNPRFPREPRVLTPSTAFGSSVGLFFSADIFFETGARFDERIGAGTALPAAEELDVLLSALLTGYKGFYDPDIVVYHPIKQRSTLRQDIRAREAAHFYVFGKYLGLRDAAYNLRVIRRSLRLLIDAMHSERARTRAAGMINGYALAVRSRWRRRAERGDERNL